jgi:hypothetical protein
MLKMDAVKKILALMLPSCRKAAELQSEALDGRLPVSRRFGLWFHLLLCKWCRDYGEQLRFLSHAAHDQPDHLVEAASQKLSDEARERIKTRLRTERQD